MNDKNKFFKIIIFNILLINSNFIFPGINTSKCSINTSSYKQNSDLGSFNKLPIVIIQKEILEKNLKPQNIANFCRTCKALKKISDIILSKLKLNSRLIISKNIFNSRKIDPEEQNKLIINTSLIETCVWHHTDLFKLFIESDINL